MSAATMRRKSTRANKGTRRPMGGEDDEVETREEALQLEQASKDSLDEDSGSGGGGGGGGGGEARTKAAALQDTLARTQRMLQESNRKRKEAEATLTAERMTQKENNKDDDDDSDDRMDADEAAPTSEREKREVRMKQDAKDKQRYVEKKADEDRAAALQQQQHAVEMAKIDTERARIEMENKKSDIETRKQELEKEKQEIEKGKLDIASREMAKTDEKKGKGDDRGREDDRRRRRRKHRRDNSSDSNSGSDGDHSGRSSRGNSSSSSRSPDRHRSKKSRCKTSTNDVKSAFENKVKDGAMTTSRSAEMRRLAVIAYAAAEAGERADRDQPGKRAGEGYAGIAKVALEMIGGLKEFDADKTSDVAGKIATLTKRIVKSIKSSVGSSRTESKAKEWLAVPGAGVVRQAAAAADVDEYVPPAKAKYAASKYTAYAAANAAAAAATAAKQEESQKQLSSTLEGIGAAMTKMASQQAMSAHQSMPSYSRSYGGGAKPQSYTHDHTGAHKKCFSCGGTDHLIGDCPNKATAAKIEKVSRHMSTTVEPLRPLDGGRLQGIRPAQPEGVQLQGVRPLHSSDEQSQGLTAYSRCAADVDVNMCSHGLSRHKTKLKQMVIEEQGEKAVAKALGKGRATCECGTCGTCEEGIDLMEKEVKSSPTGAISKTARHLEEQRASLDSMLANTSNTSIKLTHIQMRQLEHDGGAWGRGDAQEHALGESGALKAFMKSITGKKVFDKHDGRRCTFCKRKGHDQRTCIVLPSLPDVMMHDDITALQLEKQRYVLKLMATARTEYVAQSATDARDRQAYVTRIIKEGEEMNKGNPWAKSAKRRDYLRQSLGYWWAIGADRTTLGWLGFGVKLRFEAEVPRQAFRNHMSYHENVEHIMAEHATHVKDGSFEEVEEGDVMVGNPVLVEINAKGKARMCIDMRFTNAFLADYEFTQETLNQHVALIVRPNDEMITTDVAKAYYQVPLHKDSQGYCAWRHDGKWIKPTILVFGLSVAPFVFTKIMRVLLKFHRAIGISGTNCIDDNLWAAPKNEIAEVRNIVRTVFGSVGWRFNDKCVFEPNTTVLYNGMWVDSMRFEIRATDDKIEAARKMAWKIWYLARDEKAVTLNDLQVLAGRLQSLRLALEGVAVWTRGIYRAIAKLMLRSDQRPSKYERIQLEVDAMADVNFWAHRLGKQNGLPIRDLVTEERVVMHTDASDVGYGAHANIEGTETEVHGNLGAEMLGESSTAREIYGVMQAAEKMKDKLKGKRVRIYMDSYPAICNFINGGGSVEQLSEMIRRWWLWCKEHNVTPLYTWQPRESNTRADDLSKIAAEAHTLAEGVEARVRQWLEEKGQPGMSKQQWMKTRVIAPRFNNIGVRLAEMIKAQRPACIVVPRFIGAPWRVLLTKASKHRLPLGRMSEVITTSETAQDQPMEAHIIVNDK